MFKRNLVGVVCLMIFSSGIYAGDDDIRKSLINTGIRDAEITHAPVPGMKTVIAGSQGVLYVTDDGKYLIQGPLYNISGKEPVNVTNVLLLKKMESLEKEMIIYKAPQEKYVITVFTDTTCPYCRKLHEEMDAYNSAGITVRYLAFPRQGTESPGGKEMNAIWCAADRKKAFDDAMNNRTIKADKCNSGISRHYELGGLYGVNGTPAIILSDGLMMQGYQGSRELVAVLSDREKRSE